MDRLIRNASLKVSLITPVMNEFEALPLFLENIKSIFNSHNELNLEMIFINDGSTDDTLSKLLQLQEDDPRIRIINLSRNFGKEAALSAGLKVAKGQVVIPIDVDLQDPPELILEMIKLWRDGFDVVLGRRINRDSDSFAKKISANSFYWIHNKISSIKLPENVGDFRLMDRCVIDELNKLPESRRFMKGLFAWVGFKTTYIDYIRPSRILGKTKFNGWRLWNLALEGLTSFTPDLLKLWTYFGVLVSMFAFIFGVYVLIKVLIYGIDVPGYASIIISVMFLGGLQLIGIGVLGEYLGRTYLESKRRPAYIVSQIFEPKVNQ
ncbi:bactoprenol glucosyl transferase [Polynucleobacter asymbioticus]|uniref:Bactoprenol glucosyl transferase n=2 Tax=Polynucleobacter asymbioticus TaxID=576611 RepID=A0AAC9IRR5_9BURK|nr:bactoprenol glucosyl transferase [Polynucleobacter asymbioticus]APC00665.1 bactoprenol glucosyl transferase [Polynucleobacter asymbioticus]